MAEAISIEINDEEIQKALKTIADGKMNSALEKAIEKACLIVERSSKQNCPVDTGELRNSITHSTEVSNGEVAGYVGSNVEYAPYIHEGTGIYATNGNGRKEVPWFYTGEDGKLHSTKGTKPTPFIQDAIESNRNAIMNAFAGVLSDLK